MWRATLKGIAAHKVRLLLTTLAVVLGVGFVAGTYILTDTMNAAFDNLFREVTKGVAVEVTGVPEFEATGPGGQTAGSAERVPPSLLDSIRGVPGVRAVEGSVDGYAQLIDEQGEAVTTGGAPTFGTNWLSDPELNALSIRRGAPPSGSGEVAVDAATAEKHHLHIGDTVHVLLQGPTMEARIVGIVGFGESDNLGGATLVVFDTETAQAVLGAGETFDSIEVAAESGVSPAELRDRIQDVLPKDVQARTGEEAATANASDIKKALSFFTIALLVFADVALFVGAFVIYNTFSILVAQRTRELALLRALGASRSQVRRSVIAEAAIVGVVASVLGIGFGFVIAAGMQALLQGFGIDLPTTTMQILPRTIVAAAAVGIGTTVFSSVAPASRASKVPPVAALRDVEAAAYRFSTRRTVAGAAVTLAGGATLLLGLFGGTSQGALLVGVGAAVTFVGVAVLSPLVARPFARLAGAPLPRLSGISGKLGRENAIRNPKRTAATAAALMIGLGLVGFVSIFAASIKASTSAALEETLKADYIVSTSQFTGFSADVAHQLDEDPAFGAVSEVRIGLAGYRGKSQQLEAVDPATITQVAQVEMISGEATLGDDDLWVWEQTATSNGWKVGDTIPMEFARTGNRQLTITGIYEDNRLLGNLVISLDTYDRNFTEHLDAFVLAKSAPGVSQTAAKSAAASVAKAFPNVRLQDQAEFRESQAAQIDQLLGLVTALLGLAILIALFGIVNTLALSIFERTREIGLLRAVGMARRQVKSMVRWESVIIAVFGAVLGMVVGVFFGWAMVHALSDQGVTSLAIPGGQLLLYVALAGLAGITAAVLPARRAARLNVLRAVTTE